MTTEYSPEIKTLLAIGAKDYALKKFDAAVESYADACQLYSALVQSTSNGSEDIQEEDPELLYLYGQALYQMAVTNNGLFGGADAKGNENNQEDGEENADDEDVEKGNGMFQFSEDVPLAEEDDAEEDDQEKEEQDEGEEEPIDEENKDQTEGANEQPEEEQQSDFEVAWEILDLSRTLFEQNLSKLTPPSPSSEAAKDLKLEYNSILFKIAEIYDLLGEISLETENFPQSIEDFTKSLDLKTKLFPFNSNLISEIHYKLSLSYEFNFNVEGHKELAIDHLSKAIKSIEARDEVDMELVKELKVKLSELQKDEDEKFNEQKKQILQGILGQSSADSSSATGSKVAAATAPVPANDLTSMVRKRKSKQDDSSNKKQKTWI